MAQSQRKITPVQPGQPSAAKTEQTDPDGRPTTLRETHDDKGNVVFIDTVTGMEWVDTLINNKPKGNIYPKLYTVTAGVNVWDPVMRLLGQHYGLGEVWGELSLYNRYNPILVLGLGQASMTPDGQNYTYRSPMAPYFKLGVNYNILYNSDPRYQVHVDISGVGQATDSLLYASGTSLHLVYLPFRSKYNTTSYVFHYTQSGIDSPEYNDTISFAYTSEPYFASEECGAMLTYTITGMTHTRHLIQSVEIVDSLITNTDIERIKIYFRTEQ